MRAFSSVAKSFRGFVVRQVESVVWQRNHEVWWLGYRPTAV